MVGDEFEGVGVGRVLGLDENCAFCLGGGRGLPRQGLGVRL